MRRRLSFFERLMYVDGQMPFNNVIMLRICGNLSPDDLQGALGKIQARHPLLRAGIVEEDNQYYFVVNNNPPKISIRIIKRHSDEDWKAVTSTEWVTPFDSIRGPMIRVVLIESERVSELMVVIHHCISDGISTMIICREILQLLDQPDGQLIPYTPYQNSLVCSDISSSAEISALVVNRSAKPALADRQYLIYWRADAKQSAILKRCKPEGTTPYAALCVAFLLAFRRVNNKNFKNKIMCPVNMRQFIKEIRYDMMFHYAPSISLELNSDPQEELWSVARNLKQSMSEKIKHFKGYEHLVSAEKLHSSLPKLIEFLLQDVGDHDFVFANLGRLEIPSDSKTFQVESALFTTGVPWKNATMLTMIQFQGVTDLAFVSNDAVLPYATAMKIKEEAINILVSGPAAH
jgi:NRPS condensation-like uncharacterized protein